MTIESLHSRPSLDFYRKQAKALVRAHGAGDRAALARINEHHPKLKGLTLSRLGAADFTLADAQLVIAREHDLASWPKFKAHLESLTRTECEQAIAEFKTAVTSGDVDRLRQLIARAPWIKSKINEPMFAFDGQAILTAASRGDRAMIEVLLGAGADLNAKSKWWAGGFGVLHHAKGDLASYLIGRGAKVDAHAAARLGMIDQLEELIRSDPSLVHARGGDGQTPLHFAATSQVAQFLIDHGGGLEARDLDHNSTPAQWAVVERCEVCRFLLKRGAEADVFMAVGLGDARLVRAMLRRNPRSLHTRIGEPPFVSPQSEASHIYGYLLGGDGATPLHTAAKCNRAAMIKLLIDAGLDVNVVGAYDDSTPLHSAAWHDSADAARALIARGADLERKSGKLHENTPLGWAVVSGAVNMVSLLLDRGAQLHDYYLKDAARGEQGEFREYGQGKPEDYAAIAELLRSHAKLIEQNGKETPVKTTESFEKLNGISTAAVKKATGKGWAEWVPLLDQESAATMKHSDIAKLVHDKYGCPDWWSQMVTVGYEQARGLREKHQKPGGYEISASKTVNVPTGKLFTAWTNEKTRVKWLPGKLEIRKTTKDKSLRASCGKNPVEVNFYAKGDSKSQVTLQHGKLKDAKQADSMKKFWKARLGRMKEVLE